MSYEVIARKWRPQVFEDLIGQAHISKTLQNALLRNRVGHAYLFSGLRGIGKTSSARVFARALRCERRRPDGNPCNACPSCLEIFEGRALDVLEIDGASNNGVDAIRDLRDRAYYLPATGSYKIYIIDEVHMLSTSAFNALLKILEEPPPHLVFLFATTEPQNIPETILSRVQRFDFKRIAEPVLTLHLKRICEAEKISVDAEALHLIAGAAEGSMRDAQSMLDQLISFAAGTTITVAQAEEALGVVGRSFVHDTLESIVSGNANQLLERVEHLYIRGLDFSQFMIKLVEAARDCHFLQLVGPAAVQGLSPEELKRLEDLSQRWTVLEWRMLFQILTRGFERLRFSPVPKLTVEMTLARAASLREVKQFEDAMAEWANVQTEARDSRPRASTSPASHTKPTTPSQAPKEHSPPIAKPLTSSPVTTPATATNLGTEASVSPGPAVAGIATWDGWLSSLRKTKPAVAAAFMEGSARIALPKIDVTFPEPGIHSTLFKDVKVMSELTALARAFFQQNVNFQFHEKKTTERVRASVSEESARTMMNDERVKAAQKYLGAEIDSVHLTHDTGAKP